MKDWWRQKAPDTSVGANLEKLLHFWGGTANSAMLLYQEPGVPVDFAITFVKLALAVRACIQYSLTLGDGEGTSGTL